MCHPIFFWPKKFLLRNLLIVVGEFPWILWLTRWSGPGSMVNNIWGHELASLPWMGPRACMPYWILWSSETASFDLQLGEVTSCAFCSSATVIRAVGWAPQLPKCSGYIHESGRLKAIFSNEGRYVLVFLSENNRRNSSKAGKALCPLF